MNVFIYPQTNTAFELMIAICLLLKDFLCQNFFAQYLLGILKTFSIFVPNSGHSKS